jgi:Asp-tRNA(Asn)/Glu-tRNA(Gln) amidotransferase B subunit
MKKLQKCNGKSQVNKKRKSPDKSPVFIEMQPQDDYSELLIELVHFVAQQGLSLKETKEFLTTKISSKGGKTPLQCLQKQGREFINELRTFVNELG